MKRLGMFAAASAMAAVMLAGCAPAEPEPEFTGPWAAEFSSFYQKADSDFARTVLEDGVVSELEIAEVWERFRTCLSSAGVTLGDVGADGSYETTFAEDVGSDAANTATVGCSRTSGESYIAPLYFWMLRNPQKLDESTIIVDCLLKAGVVPDNYTVERFRVDTPAQSVPLEDPIDGPAALERCTLDPLGLTG